MGLSFTQRESKRKSRSYCDLEQKNEELNVMRACILSRVQPFYERAVSDPDSSMHRSLWPGSLTACS